ncbi:hypothetical protein AKJ44_00225 [candidate division MSBL1 archaeon SCGC-AAA261F17]|uniref:Antitoxin n=1 Tax=candidate division MSBL1 archaeon SCGC-AAA261F17 TaxID=1698274 RepID=A0A133V7Q2_9EURY|nr:hypothetical protein AKJ44_00225 [candidate division MSBL1 archaeon SCGC-AAA261F17]
MTTTTISLSEEAYKNLKALKGENESFSDVVMRLSGGEKDKMKGFGAWSGTDLREKTRSYREEFNRDIRERRDVLSRH